MSLLGEASPAQPGWGILLLLLRGTVSLDPKDQLVQQQKEQLTKKDSRTCENAQCQLQVILAKRSLRDANSAAQPPS